MEGSVNAPSATSTSEENMEEEDSSVNIPSPTSKKNVKEDRVIPSTTSKTSNKNVEEDRVIPSTTPTSKKNVEEDRVIPSTTPTSKKNVEEDRVIPSTTSTSNKNVEEDRVIPSTTSTSKKNVEEDRVIPSTSKVNTEVSSVSQQWPDQECSNCKAELKFDAVYQDVNRVRISTLVDIPTAEILFPDLSPSDFICIECVQAVRAKTTLTDNAKKRTLPGLTSAESTSNTRNTEGSADSTPPTDNVEGSANTSASTQNKVGGSVLHPNAFKVKLLGSVNSNTPPTPPKQNTPVRLGVRNPNHTQGPVHYVLVPRLASSAAPTSSQLKNTQGSIDASSSSTSAQSAAQNAQEEGTLHCIVVPRGMLGDAALAKKIQACATANARCVLVPPKSGSAGTAAPPPPPTLKENMEERSVKISPTPLEQSMEEGTAADMPPAPDQSMEEGSAANMPPAPEQNLVEGSAANMPPAPDQSMEEGSAANMPPAPEQNLVEGSAGRCSNCNAIIQSDKTKKHLNRRSIRSFFLRFDKHSPKMVFPHLSPSDFICMECSKIIMEKTRNTKSQGGKRVWTDPEAAAPKPKSMKTDASSHDSSDLSGCPSTSSVQQFYLQTVPAPQAAQPPQAEVEVVLQPPQPPPPPPPGSRWRTTRQSVAEKLSMVINHLRCRRYRTALRKLINISGPTKTAFIKVCQELVSKERKTLHRDPDGPCRKKLTPENLSSFCWEETNAWVEEKAPATMTCLRALFPQAHNVKCHIIRNHDSDEQRMITEEEAQHLVEKRIAMVVSVALNTAKQMSNSFFQSAIAVEMWREGCPPKMFTIMNNLGISQCRQVAKRNADRMQVDHDREVKLWKGELENELHARIHRYKHKYKVSAMERNPAYSLTWDCVKITHHAKQEQIEQKGKKPAMWAFRFAHQDRIPFNHLMGPPIKAAEVSPATILPSKQTYEALRQQMKIIVMRIIVDNLTALEGLRGEVVRHIPHKYSEEMKEKSTVVNLGAIPVNSSTAEAVADIMDNLSEYVPTVLEKPHPILYCGDGLNTDRVKPSRRVGPDGAAAEQTFDGLVAAPTEFHKESLCYQDMMKMLLSKKSLRARGSLSHIRKLFEIKKNLNYIKLKFQHVWDLDFVTFVTSAYITLYAATECNLDTVDQQPSDFPTDTKAQMEWLSGLAHRLVDLVWMPPPQEDINAAAATASLSEVKKNDSCFCGEEKAGEPLVQCCSNLCGGVWFHEGCAPMDTTTDPSVTQDWFCSPECQEDGTYIYCYCKEQRGGQMVQCALMDQCRRHEWYHKDCLSLSEQGNADSEESTWYCSEMCFIASDADDHLLNYTKALVWEGLYNMTRRDVVREGDGEAMTDFWKMDMVLFWARKHLKDFTTCHRMLTGIEGFYPEHIRQDMKWNRVANLEGKPGGNIGLDLISEFMNHEVKDTLGHVKGIYNNEKMELCTKMAGMLGNDVDRLFVTGTGRTLWPAVSLSSSSLLKKRMKGDIAKFVVEYKKDHLFRYIPGRAHRGFEKFTYQQKIKTPKKMGKMMRTLARDMDLEQPFTNFYAS